MKQNEFKNKLIDNYKLTESDWEITKHFFKVEYYEPKEYFCKKGAIANKLGKVNNGIFRSFYYDDQGRDISLQFFEKGTVVILPDSFNNSTPAEENIIACTKAEIITITQDEMQQLYDKIPVWQQICKDVADIKNKKLLDRTIQFQTLTATERYHNFCNQHPEIIAQVALTHIASYLGIDIATLSRIRKKK
ncbi:Crp/Fnr family transcriptional regulator [Bacteroidota bacterium]